MNDKEIILKYRKMKKIKNICDEKNIDCSNLIKGTTTKENEKFVADEIIKEIVSFINDFYKRDDDNVKN